MRDTDTDTPYKGYQPWW